jgi:hypothetical protein
MEKKFKLNESGLNKLVNRILKEQETDTYDQMLDKIAASISFIKPVNINRFSKEVNWGYTSSQNTTYPWRYSVGFGFEGATNFIKIELAVSNTNTPISTELRKVLSAYPNIYSEILGGGNRFMLTYNGFNMNQLNDVIAISQKILQICSKYTSGRM